VLRTYKLFPKNTLITIAAVLLLSFNAAAQKFLNGSFEDNTASEDLINLSNTAYNDLMANSTSFGSYGDVDILNSTRYCGGPHQGKWYVALTGGGTDIISMKLSAPLTKGKKYTISFYDRACSTGSAYSHNAIEIGASGNDKSFGSLIYTAPLAAESEWTERTFTFTAADNFQYITVQQKGGESDLSTWVQVDDFSFVGSQPATPALPPVALSLNGRKVKTSQTIIVKSLDVTISLYDNNKIDGDIVSLWLDDSCIVRKYPLVRTKKDITIKMDNTRRNHLILHAENEGTIPPNTATIVVSDGRTTIPVTLSSDLSTSDSVVLKYEPDK
jgi:hypothetical protein